MKALYEQIDTPQILIDMDIVRSNLREMQAYCDANHVKLRPHTKTHKSPYFARLQEAYGCQGIAVAKVGEAEVMAANGLRDIFIANEIVGRMKLERICRLRETGTVDRICFGIDTPSVVRDIEQVFAGAAYPAEVCIEIEVGEKRSGVLNDEMFLELIRTLKECPHIHFAGIFCCEGHTYTAASVEECHRFFDESQAAMLHYKTLAEANGLPCETVSMGSTPAQINKFKVRDGITELRPGTYVFMDMWEAHAGGRTDYCAASVLATVISKPTKDRIVLDTGDNALPKQYSSTGLCQSVGVGKVKGTDDVFVTAVFGEHGIIYNEDFSKQVEVGDKIEIIPSHICPVVNLYDTLILVSHDQIIGEVPVLCRGKLR